MLRAEPVSGLLPASPLVRAYRQNPAALDECFPRHPSRPGDWDSRARELAASRNVAAGSLAVALEDQYRAYGLALSPAVQRNLDLLRNGAMVVVTGQQAGVLGGPLYTVYKALTAVHLARDWTERLGQPVVPVFWVAAEDHDYPEAARLAWPSDAGPVRLELKGAPGYRVSMGHVHPGAAALEALFDAAESALGTLPHAAEVLNAARAAAGPGSGQAAQPVGDGAASLAVWFARLMADWFAALGLIVLDPMWPALRRLGQPFFARALELAGEAGRWVETGRAMVQRLGYEPALRLRPGATGLYVYEPHSAPAAQEREAPPTSHAPPERRPIPASDLDGPAGRSALLQRLEAAPESFSTGVVWRPLLQDWLLPTLAFVGGPGEIAYWACLRPLYQRFGQGMPLVVPRGHATLIEPAIARTLRQLDLTLDAALQRLDEEREAFLRRTDAVGLDELFAAWRQTVTDGHARVMEELLRLDPGLSATGADNLRQMLHQVQRLEDKARQAHRRRAEEGLRRFDRVAHHLLPGGIWQERVYNIAYYQAKYGRDLVQSLSALDWVGPDQHLVYLTVGEDSAG